MIVEICVEVPDNINEDLMHLNNNLEDFRVQCDGHDVEGAEVTGFTTVNVIND